MTYSILGWDAAIGDLGVAVQSKFPGVGGLVPYGKAGSASLRHKDSGTPDTALSG